MLYAGILNFGSQPVQEEDLTNAIGSFTQDLPSLLRKDSLVLCYGKISNAQDMDAIWENNSSVLIGRVFDKEFSCPLAKKAFRNFSYLETEVALGKIWGKYVYLNVCKDGLEIVVDSTGQLPFFYYSCPDGSILFSSDIEIIFKVLSQKPDYNWEYLCSYLVYSNSSAIQTPFKNVFELPPACSLKITKNERITTPFWDPLHSYKNPNLQAKDAVSVLQSTLKPWIKPYKNICVSLSGGLDSSALVYCLKDLVTKGQNLTALNYFHSQVKSSNELGHARQVCKEIGIELMEVDASNCLPFEPSHKKHLLKPNKPFPGLVNLKWLDVINDHIPSTDSFTFLSGHGSDHIFMRPPSQKCVSDYILEKGFNGYKEQLEEIAQFYRNPLFSLVKINLKSVLFQFFCVKKERTHRKERMQHIPKWIRQEHIENNSFSFSHPIYEFLPKKILPGKYGQIDALYEGIASVHMETLNQGDPTHFPFLCEPVLEFALSFPTYELFNKGYDRYPLRKSVSETFKTDTVWRRDKSQTTGIFQLGVKRNLDYVLDLCLNGHCARKGLVDKEGLKNTITLIGNGDIKHMWPFMHLASIELFLRYWDEKPL